MGQENKVLSDFPSEDISSGAVQSYVEDNPDVDHAELMNQLTGRVVMFEGDRGLSAWGIELVIPVTETMKKAINQKDTPPVKFPESLKYIKILTLRPEELLDEDQREIQSVSKKGAGTILEVVGNYSDNISAIFDSINGIKSFNPASSIYDAITGVTGNDTAGLNFALENPENGGDTLLIFDGHGGGKGQDITIGEQYSETRVVDKEGKEVRQQGNSLNLQKVIDTYDKPDSGVLAFVVKSCNDGEGDLRTDYVPAFYPEGVSSQQNLLDNSYKVRKSTPRSD